MIGDRRNDIIAAKDNHVTSLGVLWGYGSRQELTRAGAHSLCHQPEELASAVLSAFYNSDNAQTDQH